jgi:hypothetical protein
LTTQTHAYTPIAANILAIHGFMSTLSIMDAKTVITPTGKCFCGCDAITKDGSFFLAGHDKKAESMLTKLKYGTENSVALRLVYEGYGPGLKNLLAEYNKLMAAGASNRLEYFALQSVNEMASKPGISEAVAFVGPPGDPWLTTIGPVPPAAGTRSVLNVPFLGSVLAEGYTRALSEREKEVVVSRFPGRPSMWLSNC